MRSLDFHNLSNSKAEELIRQVWLALEAHQIATPMLESRRHGRGVDIALVFSSESERAIVATALRRQARTKKTARELLAGR